MFGFIKTLLNISHKYLGEDGSAGQTEVIPTPYPPYITPKPRDNEHQPAHTDKTFTAPVGTRAELRCQTNSNGKF